MYSRWWVRLSPETCRVKPLWRIKTQLLHLFGLISLLWLIAVNVSNFSGQYLRNHWTLDIGVLGYIGIVWPKEHSRSLVRSSCYTLYKKIEPLRKLSTCVLIIFMWRLEIWCDVFGFDLFRIESQCQIEAFRFHETGYVLTGWIRDDT